MEFMEYTSRSYKEKTKRSQHLTSWTWKHEEQIVTNYAPKKLMNVVLIELHNGRHA